MYTHAHTYATGKLFRLLPRIANGTHQNSYTANSCWLIAEM